jgi:hypothetical protein
MLGSFVMGEVGFSPAFEFWHDPLGQNLAELDAPLIERVDVPDRSLHEHFVFIEGHERAQDLRCELFGEERVAGPVSRKGPVWNQGCRHPFRGHLRFGLPEGQRLALGEEIGHEKIVLAALRIQALAKADEVARDELGALVDQLVEGVLTVRAGLAPDHRSGLVLDDGPRPVHGLSIALHVELLQVGAEAS